MSNSSILCIDRTLPCAKTSGESGRGIDGNKGALYIPLKSTKGTSPWDCLMLYPRHLLREFYPSTEMQSVYSTALVDCSTNTSLIWTFLCSLDFKLFTFRHLFFNWFGSVSLFNGISTFMDYLMQKLRLSNNSSGIIELVPHRVDKMLHIFLKGISPKVNVIVRFGFELGFNAIKFHHVSHDSSFELFRNSEVI